ncbi:unnamed protein product, partial [Pleuronectes platessa]
MRQREQARCGTSELQGGLSWRLTAWKVGGTGGFRCLGLYGWCRGWLALGPVNGTLQLPSVCVSLCQMLRPVVGSENATATSHLAQRRLPPTAAHQTGSTTHSTCLRV